MSDHSDRDGLPEPRPGSKDAQILEHWDLLGQVPDREVAEKADVSVRTIASFRARHDIAAYSGPRRRSARKRRSRIDPYEHLLGKVADRVVAEKAQVSLNAVRNYRARRGIPAARRAATETPAAEGQQAFRVSILVGEREIERVVLADDLVDAARAGARAARTDVGGELVAVRWVGALL